jgi:hypothetical protein
MPTITAPFARRWPIGAIIELQALCINRYLLKRPQNADRAQNDHKNGADLLSRAALYSIPTREDYRMSVTTVGKRRSGSRTRGKLYTKGKSAKRQRVGKVTGLLMAAGAGYVAVFLAPSYTTPLLLMALFVVIGGFAMDETASARRLPTRLIGPILALGGLLMVTYLLTMGAF